MRSGSRPPVSSSCPTIVNLPILKPRPGTDLLRGASRCFCSAVKKAQDATKPQNKNYRTVAIPVQLHVHPTPGKIAAAVPNSGALKKGATAAVKLTLTRKNSFTGPVKVQLVLPDGVKSITSDMVEIAADKTEATLTLTAAADAAPGDVAQAVIRATAADFNGRVAHFDVAVGLKITE